MRISVIIPAYNAEATLGSCLRAIKDQQGLVYGEDYEVIVVDDGSTDSTGEVAAREGVMVIQQDKAGPAAARNNGAKSARGEILVFTDSDCVPAHDWLEILVKPLEDDQVTGVKGTYLTSQKEVIARFVQLEYESKYHRMQKLPRLDSIDTNSAAYRRDVFIQNGGFDTSFPGPSVEDQELSFRLSQKGYLLTIATSAKIYHCHDRNLGEYFKRKFLIGYWKVHSLRWHPDKIFNDTQTPTSQRLQIAFFWLAGLAGFGGFFSRGFLWVSLFCMLFFYASSWQLLRWIARRDPIVLLVAPWMLLIRALALGSGLIGGLIFPPAFKNTAPGIFK
jgi:glycosyltransferase involved in cell wall biosynthesis